MNNQKEFFSFAGMDAVSLLKKHLGSDTGLYDLVYSHSRNVADKALSLASHYPEPLDESFLEEAALTHDIGVYLTYAPDIKCFGSFPYICHGYLGRELLDGEGFPMHALVCERHTGTGLYLSEIMEKDLPLPHRNLVPVSLEEQLICFADKFFSKTHIEVELSVEEVRNKLKKYGEAGLSRFDRWCDLFL
jgi:uncharacterized protein